MKGNATYEYDAMGRLARRVGPEGTTEYIYDGDHMLLGRTIPPGSTTAFVTEYSYFPGVDRPHAMVRGANAWYYATDHPGNVVGLVGAYNTATNQYRYDPWGQITSSSEGVAQPLKYAARPLDAVTGLYNMRARWYDPHMGRWVSEDPIGLAGGINPYAYANNSPTNHRDPSGLKGCGGLCYLEGVQNSGFSGPDRFRNPGPLGSERGGGILGALFGSTRRSIADAVSEAGEWMEENPCPTALGLGVITAAGDATFFWGGAVLASRLAASGEQLSQIALRKAVEGNTRAATGYANVAMTRVGEASAKRGWSAAAVAGRSAFVGTGTAAGVFPECGFLETATRIIPGTATLWAASDAVKACF